MREFSRIPGWNHKKKSFITKPAKKLFLLTNSGMITSILEVSGLELHFSGTEPVAFLGAQSSLGGAQVVTWGGGGHGSKIPSGGQAWCKFTVIYQTASIAFSLEDTARNWFYWRNENYLKLTCPPIVLVKRIKTYFRK